MFAFLWETAAVKDDRCVHLAEVFCDQSLMPFQNTIIIPSAFADELLHGSHSVRVLSAFAQNHRLDALALQIGELPAHIQLPPLSLFAARKERRIFGVIVFFLKTASSALLLNKDHLVAASQSQPIQMKHRFRSRHCLRQTALLHFEV
jgi:hypothetical protein